MFSSHFHSKLRILIFASFLIPFISCSSSGSGGGSYSRGMAPAAMEKSMEEGDGQEPEFERILTYSADVTLLVSPSLHEKTLDDLAKYATESGGYFTSRSTRFIAMKIPSEVFRKSLSYVKTIGEVESESIHVEDITNQYYDTDLRLKNKIKLNERLKELLNRAEKVDEAMRLEVEISRITGEIERLKARMRMLNSMKNFSTISVRLEEPTIYGPLGYVLYYTYKGIRYLFVIQ